MTYLFVGNWKMNMLSNDAKQFFTSFNYTKKNNEAWLAPTYTTLASAIELKNFNALDIKIGAQNVHWEKNGAFTGEISAEMLQELGASFVIVGHSDRRQNNADTNETVGKRAKAAIDAGLKAIVCVGETKEEYESGQSAQIVKKQVTESLEPINSPENLILAYEPIWAIGTGLAATAQIASSIHSEIRNVLVDKYGKAGKETKILYGGSTKPENIEELVRQENIDGALVGGASLKPESFLEMIKITEDINKGA